MSESNVQRTLLTPEKLLKDEIASDMGFWNVTVKKQRRKIHYIIVKDSKSNYILATSSSVTILGNRKSLDAITDLFNELVGDSEVLLA